MKTLILYATKYGAVAEIARQIAKEIDGAVIHDLKKGDVPPIDEYECLIIGSPLYIGKIRKEVRAYVAKNADSLSKKTIGLFLSGLEPDDTEIYFTGNFPSELLKAAKVTAFFGGVYDPQKAGGFDKLLLKVAKKPTSYTNTVSDDRIRDFAKSISSSG